MAVKKLLKRWLRVHEEEKWTETVLEKRSTKYHPVRLSVWS